MVGVSFYGDLRPKKKKQHILDKRQIDCLRVLASAAAFLFSEETTSISVETEVNGVGGWGAVLQPGYLLDGYMCGADNNDHNMQRYGAQLSHMFSSGVCARTPDWLPRQGNPSHRCHLPNTHH